MVVWLVGPAPWAPFPLTLALSHGGERGFFVGCLVGRGRFETCPCVRLSAAGRRGDDAPFRAAAANCAAPPCLPAAPGIPRSLRSRPFRWAKGAKRARSHRGVHLNRYPQSPSWEWAGLAVCFVGGRFETCPYVRLSAAGRRGDDALLSGGGCELRFTALPACRPSAPGIPRSLPPLPLSLSERGKGGAKPPGCPSKPLPAIALLGEGRIGGCFVGGRFETCPCVRLSAAGRRCDDAPLGPSDISPAGRDPDRLGPAVEDLQRSWRCYKIHIMIGFFSDHGTWKARARASALSGLWRPDRRMSSLDSSWSWPREL